MNQSQNEGKFSDEVGSFSFISLINFLLNNGRGSVDDICL